MKVSLSLSLSWGTSDYIINSHDKLSSLTGGEKRLLLGLEALGDSKFLHIIGFSFPHVKTGINLAFSDEDLDFLDQFTGIITSIVSNDSGNLSESSGVGFNSESLFSGDLLGEFVDGESHSDFGVSTSVDDSLVLDGLLEDAEDVMERSFSFVDDVLTGSSDHDSAGFTLLAAGELDHFVFSDDDFLKESALSEDEVSSFRGIEGGENFGSQGGRESFDSIEIGVFDDDDSFFGEELFRVVVDELSVDEDVGFEFEDLGDFGLHFFLFGFFDLGDFFHGVDLDLGSVDFDFVVVHGSIGDEDFSVFKSLFASGGDGFFEDDSIDEVGLLEGTSCLLDDMDVVKISASFESLDSINGELCEMVLVVGEEFGGESCFGNIEEILVEFFLILRVILGDLLEGFEGDFSGLSPSSDDMGWVDFHVDEFFSFSEEFSSEDADGGSSITYFFVLGLGDIDKDSGCGVIDEHGSEDGGTIICDGDFSILRSWSTGSEDFIHTLWSKSSFNKISNSHSSNETCQSGKFSFFF